MKQNVSTALEQVDIAYGELIEIANSLNEECLGDIDRMMKSAYNDVDKLSNDAIRDLMLQLSLRSYSFSEIKEKSLFKAALAETLRKEAYARAYNETSGTAGVRENTAVINTSAEILADEIYSLAASMFKTKLTEIHHVVDSLKTVLMSRLSEAKLTNVDG